MNKSTSTIIALTLVAAFAGALSAQPHASPSTAHAPVVAAPPTRNPLLLNPAGATQQAPATYAVKVTTTKGDFFIDVTRAWSPHGADRFYNLVRIGFYDDTAFFRVIAGFMAQIGIHGDPVVSAAWRSANIPDDTEGPHESNRRGMVTFAKTGAPNSRATQIFINLVDNANLDPMGFTPFGRVRDMHVLDQINSEYGEGSPGGRGPAQARVQQEGNAYLHRDFPNLDYIRHAEIAPAAARHH